MNLDLTNLPLPAFVATLTETVKKIPALIPEADKIGVQMLEKLNIKFDVTQPEKALTQLGDALTERMDMIRDLMDHPESVMAEASAAFTAGDVEAISTLRAKVTSMSEALEMLKPFTDKFAGCSQIIDQVKGVLHG